MNCSVSSVTCTSLVNALGSIHCLTTRRDANRLLKSLVPSGRQANCHHYHWATGGSHQQTRADLGLRLPGETLTEVKGGDGLSRFSIYAGYTWTTWAGKWVILGIWTGGWGEHKNKRMRKLFAWGEHIVDRGIHHKSWRIRGATGKTSAWLTC